MKLSTKARLAVGAGFVTAVGAGYSAESLAVGFITAALMLATPAIKVAVGLRKDHKKAANVEPSSFIQRAAFRRFRMPING